MRHKYALKGLLFIFMALTVFEHTTAQSVTYEELARQALAAKRAKKINKSPAVTEILALERNLTELEELNTKPDKKLIEEDFDVYSRRIDSINAMLPMIASKDPKWKTNDYNEDKAIYETRRSQLEPQYKDFVRKKEIRAKIAIIMNDYFGGRSRCNFNVLEPRYVVGVNNFYELLECGKVTRQYFIEDYNIHKTIALIKEIDILDPKWCSDYRDVEWRAFYIDKLEGLVQANFTAMQTYASEIETKKDLEDRVADYWLYLIYLTEFNEAMALISPDSKVEIEKTTAAIEEAKDKIQQSINFDISMSPDRMGKIFFTKGDVERGDFDKTTPITTWDFSGPLYFRYFMKKTAMEFDQEIAEAAPWSYESASCVIDFYFAGTLIRSYSLLEYGKNSYLLFRSFRESVDLRKEIALKLGDLKYGKHEIKIELYVERDGMEKRSSLVAEGKIDLVYSSSVEAIMKADEEICVPKANMNNSALTSQAMSLIKDKEDESGNFFRPSDTYSIVRITSKEWEVYKNRYSGLPTTRYLDLVVAGKDKDGNCIKMTLTIAQDYAGVGNYSSSYLYSYSEREIISCLCF